EPPTAPHNVITDDITSRSAIISWNLPKPASVTIQYKVATESSWSTNGRNISVGAWTTSHELIGLEPFKKYALRLFTVNELGVSQPSSTVIFSTLEEAPSGSPEGVRVDSGGQRSLLVSWRTPKPSLLHGPLRGYILAYRKQSVQESFTFITRPVTAPGLPVEEKYTLSRLQPSTFYEVAVQAFTKAGLGPLSSPRIVHATDVDVPLCPPLGVTCRPSSRRNIRIWWSPPQSSCENNSVTGYKIVAIPTQNTCPVYNAPWEVNTTNLEKSLDFLPPASNLSIQVHALNAAGIGPSSQHVLCTTLDEEPGAPENLQLGVLGESKVLVSWEPPSGCHGTINHYTLSYMQRNKPQVDLHVRAGDMEHTWKEINGLTPGIRLEVWLTASTVMGESGPSTRISVLPTQTSSSPPIALTGNRVWRVSEGSGVTLGCRAQGSPTPTISWTKDSQVILSSHLTQLLPGGDLHINGVTSSNNYTCTVRNSLGSDSVTHMIIMSKPPTAPLLRLNYATHYSLNLTIISNGKLYDPIQGYRLHHRNGFGGDWKEVIESPSGSGSTTLELRDLPCGSSRHVYVTAFNIHGKSPQSNMLITSTQGSYPKHPDKMQLLEMNRTCLTVRPYTWLENGCSITHWKIEESVTDTSWKVVHAHLPRSTTDVGLCSIAIAQSWYLLKVIVYSTAGELAVVYKIDARHFLK
ncbi:unnamed protein product, partial [Meganyctiphanes norvegica]